MTFHCYDMLREGAYSTAARATTQRKGGGKRDAETWEGGVGPHKVSLDVITSRMSTNS